MACINCNDSRESRFSYCRSCGDNLITGEDQKQTINLLMLLLGVEMVVALTWFLLTRVLIPFVFKNDWAVIEPLYKIVGWGTDILMLIVTIVCLALTKNKNVRIILVIYMVLRIIFILGYRVFDTMR